MMSLTFGLFTQVSDSGPQGPLVLYVLERKKHRSYNQRNTGICLSVGFFSKGYDGTTLGIRLSKNSCKLI